MRHRSRSGEVDAAGSEWAMVRRGMSNVGFQEGRGERAMKYGRRDVKCSGAVELVIFAGGGEEMGVPCTLLGKGLKIGLTLMAHQGSGAPLLYSNGTPGKRCATSKTIFFHFSNILMAHPG